MSIFLRSSMCFRGPHLCSKIPKINIQGLELGRTQCKGRVAGNPWFTWCNPGVGITTRPVYTVCASAVISPLRQWLVSYAKTRFKMCHTFKHLFICNTFCCRLILLSLSLYTELALVCCTNPNNVNCFGTIFPNLNFVFASNLSRPPGPYWIRPIQKLLNCQTRTRCQSYSIHPDWGATKNSAVALGLRNNIISIIYTPDECTDEWRQNNVDLELLENCLMNGFIIFGIMFMTATGLENSPQSFGAYTVSQSRSVVTSAENPAPDNSPQSIGELRNGHVANLQELYYTRPVRKMAWYKILIQVLIV